MIQHPVPSKHLEQIGDITVSFALLDNTIQMLIWQLISKNQRIGQIITSQVSFGKLIPLAISLYKERFGEDDSYDKFKKLMKLAKKIEEKDRNHIIHSFWGAGKDNQHITQIKITTRENKGLIHDAPEKSIDDLRIIAENIRELADTITRFSFTLKIKY
jgi:hypothetical protein